MNFSEQLLFLKQQYIPLLKQLRADAPAKWGKMNVQQMVEHIRDAFKAASGKLHIPAVPQNPEHAQKLREFLLSDKPFRENTNAPFMPETPRAHKYASLDEAIAKTEPELKAYFDVYEQQPGIEIENPVFGLLNYELHTALLYKHTTHHLRQFGVEV